MASAVAGCVLMANMRSSSAQGYDGTIRRAAVSDRGLAPPREHAAIAVQSPRAIVRRWVRTRRRGVLSGVGSPAWARAAHQRGPRRSGRRSASSARSRWWRARRTRSTSAAPRSGWCSPTCWPGPTPRCRSTPSSRDVWAGRPPGSARTDDALLCRPAAQGVGARPPEGRRSARSWSPRGGGYRLERRARSARRAAVRGTGPAGGRASCERGDADAAGTLREALGLWRGRARTPSSPTSRPSPPEARRLDELRLVGARGPDRRRSGRRRRRRAGGRDRAAGRRAPVPGAAVGPADAGAVPVGPPARRARRVPAGPVGAGRRAGHRARARTAAPGGGRSSPRTPRSMCCVRSRTPARAGCRSPWSRSARPSSVATPSWSGCRSAGPRRWPGGAGSCRCSDRRASARPVWSPSWPAGSMPRAASCCTGAATTPTGAPGRCWIRRCAAPAASLDRDSTTPVR